MTILQTTTSSLDGAGRAERRVDERTTSREPWRRLAARAGIAALAEEARSR